MSQVRANEIANAAGTGPASLLKQWALKASVRIEQTGPTVLHSQNIASLVDIGAGATRYNFTSAFASANAYAQAQVSNNVHTSTTNIGSSATGSEIYTSSSANVNGDVGFASALVEGTLA